MADLNHVLVYLSYELSDLVKLVDNSVWCKVLYSVYFSYSSKLPISAEASLSSFATLAIEG